MALPTYSTGTASVAAGGTVITGAGGSWTGINAKQGDFISIGGSDAVLITEVTDSTHLKCTPWPDAAKTSQPYIIYQSYVGRVVGVAAAEDVGVMLEKLHTDGLPFILNPSETVPDPSYGDDGQFAYKPSTGQWWTKTGGVWVASAGLSQVGYGGTSTTSILIGTGSKVFTTQAGLGYNGARVRAASSASPTNWLEGIATYSGSTLTITSDATGGSGTFASWAFSIAGTPGTAGSGGDVVGPASAVADRLAVYNGTTGKLIKDGGTTVALLATAASVTSLAGTVPAAATVAPLAPGTAAVGVATKYAREDHVHPGSSTTKAINGLLPSNDVTTPNTKILVSAGSCRDGGGTRDLVLATGLAKTTAAWVAGTNNGGLDSGSIAANTSYHIWLIHNSTTVVTDILLSGSAASPTMPSGYNFKRRIGTFQTDSAASIVKAQWRADGSVQYTFPMPILSRNMQLISLLTLAPSTPAAGIAGTVPLGVKVKLKTQLVLFNSGGTDIAFYGIVRDPDNGAPVNDATLGQFGVAYRAIAATLVTMTEDWTSTAGQIYTASYPSGANNVAHLYIQGYLDLRDEYA